MNDLSDCAYRDLQAVDALMGKGMPRELAEDLVARGYRRMLAAQRNLGSVLHCLFASTGEAVQ